ncbi:MAG: DUF924 family protein [Pseudomonadota bacterium]
MTALPSPQSVLDYWIGEASHDAAIADVKMKLWFEKSAQTHADIANRFLHLMDPLANGLAREWAQSGPKERLAAIIALDQFSRNLFRDTEKAFANDPLALALTKDALAQAEDKTLSEVERIFLYLPLEHSEDMADQDASIQNYQDLLEDARPDFKALCENTLDYAHRHRDVIKQYGRFPHRNKILGRENTDAEAEYLSRPGAGF